MVTDVHVSILGYTNHVQGHRNANVCKQTFDGSCKVEFTVSSSCVSTRAIAIRFENK